MNHKQNKYLTFYHKVFAPTKKFVVAVCFIGSFSLQAQNRITDYCLTEVKTAFPKEMGSTANWIEATFANLFVANFQYSNSVNQDNSFYSFSLAAPQQIKIPLHNLNGITINPDYKIKSGRFLITEQIAAELMDEKMAYLKSFSYEDFDYSNKAYFDLGLKIERITNQQLLAHTFNYFVEPKGEKKDKFQQFMEDVNKKNKLKLNYTDKEKSIDGLFNYLTKNSTRPVQEIVFKTYLLGKKDSETKENLGSFFNITSILGNDPIGVIDRILAENLKIKFETSIHLEFPFTLIKTLDNQPCLYTVENVEAKFDCKRKQTTIVLFGKFKHKSQLVNGKRFYREFNKDKEELIKNYELAAIEKIEIVIKEKSISLKAVNSENYDEYLIVENKIEIKK